MPLHLALSFYPSPSRTPPCDPSSLSRYAHSQPAALGTRSKHRSPVPVPDALCRLSLSCSSKTPLSDVEAGLA